MFPTPSGHCSRAGGLAGGALGGVHRFVRLADDVVNAKADNRQEVPLVQQEAGVREKVEKRDGQPEVVQLGNELPDVVVEREITLRLEQQDGEGEEPWVAASAAAWSRSCSLVGVTTSASRCPSVSTAVCPLRPCHRLCPPTSHRRHSPAGRVEW